MSDLKQIVYLPLEMGINEEIRPNGPLRLSYRFAWDDDDDVAEKLIADFSVSSDLSRFLRIEFENATICRVLDETWLSTATMSKRWAGDLSAFAREVVGDDFAVLHQFFFDVNPTAKHYQFVTDWACLDVLAFTSPRFELCQISQPPD